MIKYYEELENRDKYYLPLMDRSAKNKIEVNRKLPISFYERNKKLFIFGKQILEEFEKINDKLIIRRYNLGLIDYNDLFCISSLENIKYEENPFEYLDNIANISAFECKYYFSSIIKILTNLSIIFKEKKQYYEELKFQFIKALEEMENLMTINYDASKKVKVYLPNIWYITSSNDLYNPTGPISSSYNHKEASLVYPFEHVKKSIFNNVSLEPALNKLKEEKFKIQKENSITRVQFKHYLNYEYDISSIKGLNNEEEYFNEKTHIRNITQTVKGIISAEISLYSFFVNLQKYSKNPKKEFDKLISMTYDDICDILVRCCGIHKIDSCHEKMIVTSELLYEKEFYEYIKNNWKIDFVPPIIINRERGKIEEVNMDSLFIQKYIENNKVMKLR